MKPYQTILIQDNGEPLVAIPLDYFAVESPHPYEKLGAPYQGKSPYYLRKNVVCALKVAQDYLQEIHSTQWRIKIFDAYRPIQVQQFMVDYTFATIIKDRGFKKETLTPKEKEEIWQEVYQLWAIPSLDLKTPPPHSTGAAVDITLVNEFGTVAMGGEIDEVSPVSHPDYYAHSQNQEGKIYHQHREILHQVMKKAGFLRHPGEWWHFSCGDQMWAWLDRQQHPEKKAIAIYGRC